MAKKQSKKKAKPLSYFIAINTILMVCSTSFVTTKEWLTISGCLIGPASWFIAFYLERFLILYGPSSLEEAKFERANKKIITELKARLLDETIASDVREVYRSMLDNAYLQHVKLLEKRQNLAFENASDKNLTTSIQHPD